MDATFADNVTGKNCTADDDGTAGGMVATVELFATKPALCVVPMLFVIIVLTAFGKADFTTCINVVNNPSCALPTMSVAC